MNFNLELAFITKDQIRPKVAEKINKYLALSDHNHLTVGLYKGGRAYVLGDSGELDLFYDIGSVTKTMTAHLILKLKQDGRLDINKTVDNYLPLKGGKYPTLYQLLTHTAGYHHLTPAEITLPALLKNGYAKKNPYEGCTVKSVIGCLQRRRFIKPVHRYGYSDFASAILAAVAEQVTKTPFSELLEDFIKKELKLTQTILELDPQKRNPPAARGNRLLPFWVWNRDNPYIAGGGIASNVADLLKYIALQLESGEEYISSAHETCNTSVSKNSNHLACMGWHTYKKSNQLWHVGGVGTFRTSVILNRRLGVGVAVLGNAKGRASANAHYIAKMLYSELKNNRIKLNQATT